MQSDSLDSINSEWSWIGITFTVTGIELRVISKCIYIKQHQVLIISECKVLHYAALVQNHTSCIAFILATVGKDFFMSEGV